MSKDSSITGATLGVGCGSIIAGLISWDHTQSVLWTFLHIVFGWLYVIHALVVGRAHF
ncbi:MAG: hypothetical protein WCL39_09225 [Armatimonadota bacterium]